MWFSRSFSSFAWLAVSLLFLVVSGQDLPIALTGGFEDATATSNAFNTGGTVRLMGFELIVPENLQVVFPAAFIPWREFVLMKSRFVGYEMDVVGNFVNEVPIAGMISVSQFSLGGSIGLIDRVNSAAGTLEIEDGPIIRINDPEGFYGVPYTADPFFTADTANPSITSFSGFPMCIPRNASDPGCPTTNRPLLAGNTRQGVFIAPDALVMAPFMPGDFIEYSGIRKGNDFIATSITALNVQIMTDPTRADHPTYIRLEDAIIGVWTDDQNNAESAGDKFVGFTSSAVGSVTFTALDLDPCTGEESLRQIGTTTEIRGNRFKFDWRGPRQPGRYAREYLVTTNRPVIKTKNGILAGQYISAVGEWIQPELTTPGLMPPGNVFGTMDFLSKGLGYDEEGNLWGPLNPFPQSGVTVFNSATCPPFVPPSEEPPAATTTTTSATTTSTAGPVVTDTVTFQTLTWESRQSGTLAATCRSVARPGGRVATSMTLQYTNRDGAFSQTMLVQGGGLFAFSSRSIKQPTGQVLCVSNWGGVATRAAP